MSTLFDSEFIKKIEQMSLHIRFTMDGSASGNRKSRSRGSSVEFSDYREYTHGDDFRRVDWNAYGRFEKLFVKLFMEEREAPVTIFLDVSKSMDWGKPNKSIASRRLAAALAYMCLAAFDRVSLYCIDEGIQSMQRNVRGKNFFHKLTSLLENVQYKGGSDIKSSVESARMTGDRGITIIISDFFTRDNYPGRGAYGNPGSSDHPTGFRNPDAAGQLAGSGKPGRLTFLRKSSHQADLVRPDSSAGNDGFNELIKYCRYKKQMVYICHILSPQEIKPDFEESVRLIDSETNEGMDITVTPALLDAYAGTLDAFTGRLEQTCFKWGANYALFSSGQLLEEMIKEVAGR